MQIDHFHTPAEEPACGALQGLSLFSILLTAHIKSCGEFISTDTVESHQLHEVWRFIYIHHFVFVPTYTNFISMWSSNWLVKCYEEKNNHPEVLSP